MLASLARRVGDGRSDLSIGKDGITIKAIPAELEKLPEAHRTEGLPKGLPEPDWTAQRQSEYVRTGGLMLAHVYRPSTVPGQKFDAFVFLLKHQKGTLAPPKHGLHEVKKAEFYFGNSWGGEVFEVVNTGGAIGVQTHAYGTFLAMCRVTFQDPKRAPLILYRYVDFFMLANQFGDA